MISRDNPTTPYWSDDVSFPPLAALSEDLDTDILVVGGGITGLTAAWMLTMAGKRVVVIERGRCAGVDTGHTSAHLTMVTDTRLSELVRSFGRDHARAVWDAGLAAIMQIDHVVRTEGIAADFAWVDGYLHAPVFDKTEGSDAQFEEEADVARSLGFEAEYVRTAPIVGRPGVRFRNQARFHPGKYLAAMAARILAAGGRIHEHSTAERFERSPRSVVVNDHIVTFDRVVMATHNPLAGLEGMAGATLFQTKLALYTSYVVAARIAKRAIPDALWWDTADPYHYLRIAPQETYDLAIFGGADHKTGQESDTAACFRRLEQRLRSLLPAAEFTHRWSGQVIETPDGLPYIGRSADGQYSATGFAGNGMTFGTLAGMMIADAILQRPNPWADLFDPARKAVAHGLWDYAKENADYPYYMIRDRFAAAKVQSLSALERGQGAVVDRDGGRVAAYRDPDGAFFLRSAVCPHMGCTVTWNRAERTWDCPCHGSRFRPDGSVISGPANAPLPPVD